MCCNGDLGKDIQYQDRSCPDCPAPFAQVCISCPPPCPIPLCPCPVKPLQLPCPHNQFDSNATDAYIEKIRHEPTSRYDNFYNNYNVDWHSDGQFNETNSRGPPDCQPPRANGTTMDGKSPCCEDYTIQRQQRNSGCCDAGCPTGFKPCKMKLHPPPCCNPCGCWTAEVQKCPSKPKKKRQSQQN